MSKYIHPPLLIELIFVFCWLKDSPDQGALYLVRGLLNVVQEYTWELHGGSKMTIYLNAIGLLSAMSQVSATFLEDRLASFWSPVTKPLWLVSIPYFPRIISSITLKKVGIFYLDATETLSK